MVKKKMKRFVGMLLAASVLSMGVSGCGNKQDSPSATGEESTSDDEVLSIRAGVQTGDTSFFLVATGLEKGIFEKHKINVEYTEYTNGIHAIDGIAAGSVDVSDATMFAGLNRLGNTLDETDLVIVSGLMGGYSSGGIYVAPQYADDLQSLDGSEGFIVLTGAISEYNTTKLIDYLGFDPSKQELVYTDSHQTGVAIASKDGASAVWANANAAGKYEDIGWVEVATSEEVGLESSSYLFVTKPFYEENEEAISRYLAALYETYDYINDNTDEVATFLESEYAIDPDTFLGVWNDTNKRLGLTDDDLKILDEMEDWLYQNEKIPTDFDVRQYLELSAARTAFPDEVTVTLD